LIKNDGIVLLMFELVVVLGMFSSAGSDDDDDDADPEVKVVKEKERRQANNARERYYFNSFQHNSFNLMSFRRKKNYHFSYKIQ